MTTRPQQQQQQSLFAIKKYKRAHNDRRAARKDHCIVLAALARAWCLLLVG